MPLHQRDRRAPVLEHYLDCLVIHRVGLGIPAPFGGGAVCLPFEHTALEDALDVVRCAQGLEVVDDMVDLVVGDIGAMNALRQAASRGQIEHVTLAEKGLCPHLVENGARIDLGRNLERHARRNVGLDQAGDHINARALRGEDKVNA